MTDLDQFELRLAAAVRADANLGVGRFDPAAIARAAIVVGRSRSLRGRLHSAVFGNAVRVPRRYPVTNMRFRLAAVGLVGVLAVGGALYLLRPGPAVIGGPTATPAATASASPSASPTSVSNPTTAPVRAASWTATGSMVTPREGHTATLLPDGKVLVAGGLNWTTFSNPNGTILASTELYDPASGTWTATGSMGTARQSHTATLLPDGKVLVAGGFGNDATQLNPVLSTDTSLASAELYNPATGTWTATGTMTRPRGGAVATLLPSGKVLVVGGVTLKDGSASMNDFSELYDPASGTWTATRKMVYGGGGAATLLPDGKVLVAGGVAWGIVGGGYGTAATAELYDPTSGVWTATGNLVAARTGSTATLLTAGNVLVACGCDHAGRASELYDPTTGSWTATGTMVADHWRDTATMLPDGKVTATLLADGKVLVAGGGPPTLPAAELYDPSTGSWAAADGMIAVRLNHTATLLADGKVLFAGGGDRFRLLAPAELYDPGSGQ